MRLTARGRMRGAMHFLDPPWALTNSALVKRCRWYQTSGQVPARSAPPGEAACLAPGKVRQEKGGAGGDLARGLHYRSPGNTSSETSANTDSFSSW